MDDVWQGCTCPCICSVIMISDLFLVKVVSPRPILISTECELYKGFLIDLVKNQKKINVILNISHA